jgi:glutathione synthase/RimK-type ligase-like ATP-grasp enzyme
MDYGNMLATVSKIHAKTGKSRIWLFFDMVRCGIRYGAGYKDYMLCEFYNLTADQRATYVTRGINNQLVRMLNDREYYHCVENKVEFNRLFAEFIHRGWLDMDKTDFDTFSEFMQSRQVVISKPASATCGKGIEKLNKSDFADLREMYDHIKSAGSGLVEDYIIQHPDVSAIYPDSVNTYRIVTVLSEGRANVVYAFIRIGNGGRFVDNINSGGMAAPINVDTGVIQYAAFDKDSVYYDVHPSTGCRIAGYQLPYWRESVEMCLKAAHVVPQLGYVGWDIAVSADGPQLIEGNHFPGHDILQMPPHVPDKIGMLPRFKEFVKGL